MSTQRSRSFTDIDLEFGQEESEQTQQRGRQRQGHLNVNQGASFTPPSNRHHSFRDDVVDEDDIFDSDADFQRGGYSGPHVTSGHAAHHLPSHSHHLASTSLNSFGFSPSFTAARLELPAVTVRLNSRTSSTEVNSREDLNPNLWYQLGNQQGARYQLIKAEDVTADASLLNNRIIDIQKALDSDYSDKSEAAVAFVHAARDLGLDVPKQVADNYEDYPLNGSLPELETGDTVLSIHRIPVDIYDQIPLNLIDENERKFEYGLVQTCLGPGQMSSQLIMANNFKIENSPGQLNENYNLLLALISQQVDTQIKTAGGQSIKDVNSLTLGGPANLAGPTTAYELAYIHFCHLSRVGCQFADGTPINIADYEDYFPKDHNGVLQFDQLALASCSETFEAMTFLQRASSGMNHEDGVEEEKYNPSNYNGSHTPDFTSTQAALHHRSWTPDSRRQDNPTFSSQLFNPVLPSTMVASSYSPIPINTSAQRQHHQGLNPSRTSSSPSMFTPSPSVDARLGPPTRTGIQHSPLTPLPTSQAIGTDQDLAQNKQATVTSRKPTSSS